LRTWTLSRSRDGTAVSLDEAPFWAWAAQTLGENICWALEKTTGVCLIDPPEWMWSLRWGKPDADGYTERCAGHVVSRAGNALCSGFGAWRRGWTAGMLPVTDEWVREHQPDAGWPFGRNGDDDGGEDEAGD
jgi:hypothetical protein